jgi:hypothetical protein
VRRFSWIRCAFALTLGAVVSRRFCMELARFKFAFRALEPGEAALWELSLSIGCGSARIIFVDPGLYLRPSPHAPGGVSLHCPYFSNRVEISSRLWVDP